MAYDYPASAKVNANGIGVVSMQFVPSGQIWEVRQISCYTSQPTSAGTVGIWKNGILQTPSAVLTPLVTPQGVKANGATAAGLPYITVRSTDNLQVIFSGCISGDTVIANFILEIFLDQDYVPSPFG